MINIQYHSCCPVRRLKTVKMNAPSDQLQCRTPLPNAPYQAYIYYRKAPPYTFSYHFVLLREQMPRHVRFTASLFTLTEYDLVLCHVSTRPLTFGICHYHYLGLFSDVSTSCFLRYDPLRRLSMFGFCPVIVRDLCLTSLTRPILWHFEVRFT